MTGAEGCPERVLADGVDSLAGQLQVDGTLADPVFDCPTQYGSAYYGWCCAVLAGRRSPAAEVYRERARQLLATALAHTADPSAEPYASGFDRRTLSVTGRLNHRDFTWPPIWKTYRALGSDPRLRAQLAGVEVAASFRSRPPSNWAAVWMSGEWLRMQSGLSPTSAEEFDDWIDVFFTCADGVGFDPGLGMYLERGLPNAYDLFTRAHFTDLLVQGYQGRHRQRLADFLTNGLRRSLATQLSDGSMASGYRSAGQTWVLGAQIALFTGSRSLGLGAETDQEAARLAAWRAFDALATWQRPGGVFSPVQNRLAPQLRVGYEQYTSDGHYSPLALAFLASAIVLGFGEEERPGTAELDARGPATLAEGAPSHRGVAHRGRISAAVQAQADRTYDATGLVDLTFGSGRLLQLVSAARHLSGGPWLVPGLAVRSRSGAAPVVGLGGLEHEVTAPVRAVGDSGLAFSGKVLVGADESDPPLARDYSCEVQVTATGVAVVETVSGAPLHLSLLLPYLRDLGGDLRTVATVTDSGVRLALGEEWVELVVAGEIERCSDLPYGYESRRGLCGLVRLDLLAPTTSLTWQVTSSS